MSSGSVVPSGRNVMISGFAYAAAAAVMWSLIGPFTKNCLAAGVSPMETAFWRAVFGCVCFAAQTAVFGGLRIPLRDAAIFFAFGALAIGALFSSLQIAIELSGAAMTMVLLYTAPMWVAVYSRVIFKESVTGAKLAAIATAMCGVALVCLSGGSLAAGRSALGIACGLLSGLAFASQFPFYVWWNNRYSTATIYTYMLLGGVVFLFPFTEFAPGKAWDIWGNLFALGFFTNFVAYAALARSLKKISQVHAAVVSNIEPVLAALWVCAFYGENFTITGWIGSALIISAVFVLTLARADSGRS